MIAKLAPDAQIYANTQKTVQLCGLSASTLKRLRFDGRLREGLHWTRVTGRILFCLPLLIDWLANQSDPAAHDRAIQNFLATLPSNRKAMRKGKCQQ